MEALDPARIILMAILLCFSAFFSGTETALFSLSPITFTDMRKSGWAGRLAVALAQHPRDLLVSVLFGNMLVNVTFYVLSASAAHTVYIHHGAVMGGIFGAALLLCVIVFGEVLPKAVAVSHPLYISRLVALPAYIFVNMIGRWVALGIKPMMKKPSADRVMHTTREELHFLLSLSSARKNADARASEMALDIIALSDLRIKDVMVPRTDVVRAKANTSIESAVKLAAPMGIHRLVIISKDETDALGIVTVPQMLGAIFDGRKDEPVHKIAQNISFFPEFGKVAVLMDFFHRHLDEYMVAVVDEYGDFSGIVTLEDLIEVFMGDIGDEYEMVEPAVRELPDGSYRLPGTYPVHEWLDVMCTDVEPPHELESAPYSTVAGLIIHHLGRLPKQGDKAVIAGIKFIITKVSGHRILEVEAHAGSGECREL